MTDGGGENVRLVPVVVVDLPDLLDELDSVAADVVDPSETRNAPALATSIAWSGWKQSVMFVRTPFSESVLHALSPSGMEGSLMTILSAMGASWSASRTMPS